MKKKLFWGAAFALAATATACWPESARANEPALAFETNNVDFSAGGARAAKSGDVIFNGDFSSKDGWGEINNYNSKLELQFGSGDDRSELFVTRVKPIVEEEPEARDSAWSVASDPRPVADEYRGREFVLRVAARSSKQIDASEYDGDMWRGGVTWYDEKNEEIGRGRLLFSSDAKTAEKRIDGVVPENAASYVVRVGFDAPNLLPDEYAVVSKATLEVVDPQSPYQAPGEFISGIYRIDGDQTTFEALSEKTSGTGIDYEFYGADEIDGRPGEFTKRASISSMSDGDNASFKRRDKISIGGFAFFRYRAILKTNGQETPAIDEVHIGENVETRWIEGGDVKPPRVRLIGDRATPDPDPHARVAFSMEDASIVLADSVKVAIDDEDATERFKRIADVDGNVALEEDGTPDYAPGLHKVVVTASDVYENVVEATRYFLVAEPTNTPRITLRDDGVTLVDGEPFFPIGIYGVTEREFNGNNIDEAFRGLKEAGFNFAHSYSMPREDKFLEAAEKYGFKLWSVARFPDERFVEIERFSPAILSWYLGDDTSMNTTPEELDDYFFSMKAVDPTRITVQADPIASANEVTNYRPYVAGTDAFLPEIYPVRKEGAEAGYDCVAHTVRDVTRSRSDAIDADDGPKAIWPIIQYFQGWGWERFPTYQELRAMSFASLAAGANGITWYTYGGSVNPEKKIFNYGVTTTPERWQNISTIATQINELSPMLLERTDPAAQPEPKILEGPELNTLDGPTVVCLLKRFEGKTYLLAVNTTPEKVKASFAFTAPQKDGRPETLYDEKDASNASFVDGALVETFEPFGVRIWRW